MIMNRNFIFSIIVIAVVAIGIICCEKREAPKSADFINITNTEKGQEFVSFIEQHREKLKNLFLSNGYSLEADLVAAKGSTSSDKYDWLGIVVIALIKKEKIASIFGTVFINVTHKLLDTDFVMPTYVSFYFRKFNNQWKLAVREDYFVEPYEDEGSRAIDIPPEIYAGINKIFPEQFTVNY